MGVFQTEASLVAIAGGRTRRKLPTILAIFVFSLALSSGQASAIDRLDPAGAIDGADMALSSSRDTPSPSSATADKCLPLLKSIRQTTSISAMDRNQRAAGKAAALGLVLGVRFALSPSPKARSAKPRVDFWQPNFSTAGDQRALAIAEYRACQKDQALKSSLDALEEFRWER